MFDCAEATYLALTDAPHVAEYLALEFIAVMDALTEFTNEQIKARWALLDPDNNSLTSRVVLECLK